MKMAGSEELIDSVNTKTRKTWKKSVDYFFSVCGMIVGLGNIWRFPYLCYKNGGGVFLIAYVIFLVVMVFPLIVLESSIGQFTGKSASKAYAVVPIFKGIGYALVMIMIFSNAYYPMLLTWALRWLVASFSFDVPWMSCNNTWNTENCIALFKDHRNEMVQGISTPNSSVHTNVNTTLQSSVEEYWRNYILEMSPGIEDLGGVKWDIFACLLVVWTMVYFAIWKGIGWMSKVVYVTATLPIVMLIILVIRGGTLEGAGAGISVYLRPNITKLGDAELWTDAASQVLYSFGTATGALTTLSSYNKFHHKIIRDSALLVIANAFASFISGFAIFSVLGFLANVKGTTVADVAESGPGLIFVVYPAALSLLTTPQFWCALSFLAILLVGCDSLFVYTESFMACMKDLFPGIFGKKWAYEINLALFVVSFFALGSTMTTRGGMYVLHIFNTYSVSGWCLFFVAFCEYVAIGWCYGTERMRGNIHQMVGMKIPLTCLNLFWKYVGPVCALVLMIYTLSKYRPLVYDRDYIYPLWGDVLGWMTALASVLWIPATAVYVFYKSEGTSVAEKFRNAIRVPDDVEKIKRSRMSIDGTDFQSELDRLN